MGAQVAVNPSHVQRLGGEKLPMRADTQRVEGKGGKGDRDCDERLRYESPGKSGRGMEENIKR